MEPVGVVLLILVVLVAGLWGAAQHSSEKKKQNQQESARRDAARAKYAGTPYGDDILNGLIRQGMTAEMVIDAWGHPAAVDRKVYKSKVKEIWKYGPGPRRSFANKVTIENGFVVGFESR